MNTCLVDTSITLIHLIYLHRKHLHSLLLLVLMCCFEIINDDHLIGLKTAYLLNQLLLIIIDDSVVVLINVRSDCLVLCYISLCLLC